MSTTASKEILRRIHLRGAGCVFTPSDFASAAPRAAIDQTLSRLTRTQTIRRIAHGLYDLPRTHETLGLLAPRPDAVAAAIARRDNVRIRPSGAAAANMLGLSTQVPAKIAYLTDGRSRTLRIGAYEIEFIHVLPARLLRGRGAALLVPGALRSIGPDQAAEDSTKRSLGKALGSADKRRLTKSIRYLPVRMQPIVREIVGKVPI